EPQGVAATRAIARHQPCFLPWYAIKEFEAGALTNFIYAHKLLARFSLAEALVHCERLFGRNKAATARQAIAGAMSAVDGPISRLRVDGVGGPVTYQEVMRRQMRAHLKYGVLRAFRSSRMLPATYVDELACL